MFFFLALSTSELAESTVLCSHAETVICMNSNLLQILNVLGCRWWPSPKHPMPNVHILSYVHFRPLSRQDMNVPGERVVVPFGKTRGPPSS